MSVDRYSHVESRKQEGAYYTPEIFSDFISEKIIRNAKLAKSVKIVDPAVGDGKLLLSLIKSLYQHKITDITVYGYDTNPDSVKITRKQIKALYPELTLELYNRDFLEVCMEKGGILGSQDLFDSNEVPEFDLLIANPPYIRTQVLGAKTAQILSKNFGLEGRIDIYQAFLVAMKAVLSPSAIAGVVVSNKFLTTKGAGKFREILFNQYDIKEIWDFGDTKVFEAAVLPAVMLLSPCSSQKNYSVPFKSVYEVTGINCDNDMPMVANQIEALNYNGIVRTNRTKYRVRQGNLAFDSKSSDLWRLQDSDSDQWLGKVAEKTWCTFKEVGKVRVGVKTTADSVFIRSDWVEEIGYLPELLKPLTTHHVSGRYKAQEKKLKSILYTHTVIDGKCRAININEYPLSQKYLEGHKKQLANRNYVIKANRCWFEIWVPQNPSLWIEEKIVFRDISEKPIFWMDADKTVVNGDCYWMLRDNKDMPEDILWLVLAVANSKFIEDFYDVKFQNKLYSNRRRFITQYVEQFPIPDPYRPKAKELVKLAKRCYNEVNFKAKQKIEKKVDELIWSIFDVSHLESVSD